MAVRQWKNGQDGFTLVEMIITIAIAGLLVGAVIGFTGYIRVGNSKKSAAKFNGKLDTVQVENMTKEGTAYLYVYKDSDGIQVTMAKADSSYPDGFTSRSNLNSYLAAGSGSASQIGDSRVSVSAQGKDGGTDISMSLGEDNMLKIGFSKSTGAYTCSGTGAVGDTAFYDTIIFSGAESYTVRMVQSTGKHFIK